MHAGACYAQEADPRRQAAIATDGSVSPASGRGVGAAPRAPDDVGSRAHSLDRVTGLRAQGVEIVVERLTDHPALAHLDHGGKGQVQATVGRWKTKPRSREGSPKTTPVDIVVAFDDFAFVADLALGERGEARRVTGSNRLSAL
jgi:hypothetical protein